MIAYLLGDVPQHHWWPFPGWPEPGPDSLWLPCPPADEPTLVEALATASKQFTWVAMATRHHRPGAGGADLSARFPGLVRSTFDTSELKSPNGLIASTVWCEIDPASEHFGRVISMSRRSRGRGVCVALTHNSLSTSAWRTSSIGMMWRAPLAVSPDKPSNYSTLDGLIVSISLMAMIETGFVPVVPLDLHPSAGFVLLGRWDSLDEIAARLVPTRPISNSQDVVEELFAAGGGVAL